MEQYSFFTFILLLFSPSAIGQPLVALRTGVECASEYSRIAASSRQRLAAAQNKPRNALAAQPLGLPASAIGHATLIGALAGGFDYLRSFLPAEKKPPETKAKPKPIPEKVFPRIRSIAELTQEAQQELSRLYRAESVPAPKPAAQNFLWGEWLIQGEYQKRGGRSGAELAELQETYAKLLAEAKKILGEPGSSDAKKEKLRKYLLDGVLQEYCVSKAQETNLFIEACGNCEAQSRIFISLLRDADFRPDPPLRLALQLFNDHIQPVLVDPEEKIVSDLVSGQKLHGYSGMLFQPELMLYAFLNAGNENRIVDRDKDLLIAEADPQFRIPASKAPSLRGNSDFDIRTPSIRGAFSQAFGQASNTNLDFGPAESIRSTKAPPERAAMQYSPTQAAATEAMPETPKPQLLVDEKKSPEESAKTDPSAPGKTEAGKAPVSKAAAAWNWAAEGIANLFGFGKPKDADPRPDRATSLNRGSKNAPEQNFSFYGAVRDCFLAGRAEAPGNGNDSFYDDFQALRQSQSASEGGSGFDSYWEIYLQSLSEFSDWNNGGLENRLNIFKRHWGKFIDNLSQDPLLERAMASVEIDDSPEKFTPDELRLLHRKLREVEYFLELRLELESNCRQSLPDAPILKALSTIAQENARRIADNPQKKLEAFNALGTDAQVQYVFLRGLFAKIFGYEKNEAYAESIYPHLTFLNSSGNIYVPRIPLAPMIALMARPGRAVIGSEAPPPEVKKVKLPRVDLPILNIPGLAPGLYSTSANGALGIVVRDPNADASAKGGENSDEGPPLEAFLNGDPVDSPIKLEARTAAALFAYSTGVLHGNSEQVYGENARLWLRLNPEIMDLANSDPYKILAPDDSQVKYANFQKYYALAALPALQNWLGKPGDSAELTFAYTDHTLKYPQWNLPTIIFKAIAAKNPGFAEGSHIVGGQKIASAPILMQDEHLHVKNVAYFCIGKVCGFSLKIYGKRNENPDQVSLNFNDAGIADWDCKEDICYGPTDLGKMLKSPEFKPILDYFDQNLEGSERQLLQNLRVLKPRPAK